LFPLLQCLVYRTGGTAVTESQDRSANRCRHIRLQNRQASAVVNDMRVVVENAWPAVQAGTGVGQHGTVPVVDITVWIAPYIGFITCMSPTEDLFGFSTSTRMTITIAPPSMLRIILLLLFHII